MPRLPRVSGRKAIAALKRLGFEEQRTSGSHVILESPDGRRAVVPLHGRKDLKPATLVSVLRESRVTVKDFSDAL